MNIDGPIINTALCSFGMSGLVFHAPFLSAHPGFNLYAVWERTNKVASTIYPGILSFDSFDKLLEDTTIDLVIVNTPNHTHYDLAKKALMAGKHVLVEKAFTVTVTEAEDLVRISYEQQKLLAVFHNRMFDSDFKTVKQVISSGLLGNIIEAEFHFDRYKPELSPKIHKEQPLPGSGLLHDLGPHLIDQALYLFGLPASVYGFTRIVRPGSRVNDYFDVTLFYNDKTVRLRSSLMVKEPLAAYSVHGNKGSFIKTRADIQEDVLKTGKSLEISGWGIEPSSAEGTLNRIENGNTIISRVPSLPGNYMDYYTGLYNAIAHEKPLPVSASDGLNVIKVIAAVIQSNHLHQAILL
ncbi:MAG: Gfo/Idh/MocA family oxidoreductase [Ferruginibacter sp.]